MAFNPFTLRPAARPVSVREFVWSDGSFTLTFRKPGQLENSAAFDRGEELILRYLGDENTPGTGFPPVGGVAVKVSPTVIRNAAAYETMQPDDVAERYSAEEFVAMQAGLPDEVWNDVAAFARDVRKGADVPPTSGADTATPSESASGTPSATRKR